MSPFRAFVHAGAAAVFVASLLFTPSPAQAADPVKVGALYPLSGQVAKSGEDTLNGIRLAIEIVNKKFPDLKLPFAAGEGLPGLGGAPIQLVAADHQGSPEIGIAEAERLIVQSKVALDWCVPQFRRGHLQPGR